MECGLSTVELSESQNSFLHQIIIHDKIWTSVGMKEFIFHVAVKLSFSALYS